MALRGVLVLTLCALLQLGVFGVRPGREELRRRLVPPPRTASGAFASPLRAQEVLLEGNAKGQGNKACCKGNHDPATDDEPCIPCDQTDHVNPEKCPCPKEGMPKYEGSFGCVKTRCADPPGEISIMPKRCPHGVNGQEYCSSANRSRGFLGALLFGQLLALLRLQA